MHKLVVPFLLNFCFQSAKSFNRLSSVFEQKRCPLLGVDARDTETALETQETRVLPPSNCLAMLTASEDKVKIGDTGKYGYGAFACERIEEGVCPCDYIGEILSARDVSARYNRVALPTMSDRAWRADRELRGVTTTGNYLFAIADKPGKEPNAFIDAEDPWKSNWARFINHAPESKYQCNLRCRSLPCDMYGNPRVWFVAIRDIEVGEELLYDYGDEYWGELYTDG